MNDLLYTGVGLQGRALYVLFPFWRIGMRELAVIHKYMFLFAPQIKRKERSLVKAGLGPNSVF